MCPLYICPTQKMLTMELIGCKEICYKTGPDSPNPQRMYYIHPKMDNHWKCYCYNMVNPSCCNPKITHLSLNILLCAKSRLCWWIGKRFRRLQQHIQLLSNIKNALQSQINPSAFEPLASSTCGGYSVL